MLVWPLAVCTLLKFSRSVEWNERERYPVKYANEKHTHVLCVYVSVAQSYNWFFLLRISRSASYLRVLASMLRCVCQWPAFDGSYFEEWVLCWRIFLVFSDEWVHFNVHRIVKNHLGPPNGSSLHIFSYKTHIRVNYRIALLVSTVCLPAALAGHIRNIIGYKPTLTQLASTHEKTLWDYTRRRKGIEATANCSPNSTAQQAAATYIQGVHAALHQVSGFKRIKIRAYDGCNAHNSFALCAFMCSHLRFTWFMFHSQTISLAEGVSDCNESCSDGQLSSTLLK